MYGRGICFVSIFLLSPDFQQPSLPAFVLLAISKGGEEGASDFGLGAQCSESLPF